MTVRVLVCDDQTVVREGLAAILSTDPEIEVVGQASNGQELLGMMDETRPNLVLMDLQMPVMNGVHATRKLARSHPDVHILVLTTYADDEWLFDALQAGADGYLLKDTRREILLMAIKRTVQGQAFLDPAIAGRVMRQAASAPPSTERANSLREELTEREQDVLNLLAEGYTNPEIAERLYLAPGTVRNYVSVILQKLGVSDRTQAAVEAVRRGLLSQPDD